MIAISKLQIVIHLRFSCAGGREYVRTIRFCRADVDDSFAFSFAFTIRI